MRTALATAAPRPMTKSLGPLRDSSGVSQRPKLLRDGKVAEPFYSAHPITAGRLPCCCLVAADDGMRALPAPVG